MNDVIPAIESRGKPRTMTQDVIEAERKRLRKPKRNRLDYRGRPS